MGNVMSLCENLECNESKRIFTIVMHVIKQNKKVEVLCKEYGQINGLRYGW